MTSAVGSTGDAVAAERWRDAVARLEYAERHGSAPGELESLADEVIEARVAMVQVSIRTGRALPQFALAALQRDRELLDVAANWDDELPGSAATAS